MVRGGRSDECLRRDNLGVTGIIISTLEVFLKFLLSLSVARLYTIILLFHR